MKLILDDRKLKIIELIAENESVSVKELSRLLKVSEATIRTDFNLLEKNGKIVRYHGGARLIENRYKQEYTYQARKNLNFQQKKEIGKIAATLVASNDSILLDASTTSLALAQALRERDDLHDVTIIPLGIWTAIEFLGYTNFNILLPSGYLRHASASITGLPTNDFFEGLIVQKAFMGAWGISVEQGLTDSHLLEIEMKKMILKKAKEVIVLIDGSKFNQSGLASYASVDKISKIITDKTAPLDEVEKIRKLGIKVIVAN